MWLGAMFPLKAWHRLRQHVPVARVGLSVPGAPATMPPSLTLGSTALCTAAIVSLAALYTDAKQRNIPHWQIATLFCLWLFAALLSPQILDTPIQTALVAAAIALFAGYIFHALNWLGAGDGKLLAVLALWLGLNDIPFWLIGTAAIGLILVVVALARPNGDFRTRGIPFAWAIVPPAATLLIARAISLSET